MAVNLRSIKESDLELIMQWRMDPDITRYMNTNPKLTLDSQKKWLSFIKTSDNVRQWMIEVNEMPAGIINIAGIDWEKRNASWGYYIGEKKLRSLRTSLSLEMSLYDYVFDILGLEELHNEVFSLNTGVIKLHEACGSRIINEVKGEVEKEGVSYDVTHMSITADEWRNIRKGKKYERIAYEIDQIKHPFGGG